MVTLDALRQRVFCAQFVFAACACCLFLVLGIQSTFSIPPFQVPDESRHWVAAVNRVNSVTSLFGKPRKSPECSVEFGLVSKMAQDELVFQPSHRMPRNAFGSLRDTPRVCETSKVPYGSALTYPGVLVSKLFLKGEERRPFSALAGFYAARIIHGLLVLAALARLLYLAFRAKGMPIGLVMILGLVCSPLFVQQSFGVSADPICFMFALSLLGILLFPSFINRFDVIVSVLLAFTASHTKPPMALFGMSAALLAYFRSPRAGYRMSFVLIVLASLLGGGLVALSYNTSGEPSADAQTIISGSQQLALIMSDPLGALIKVDGVVWVVLTMEQLAHPLGWLDTYIHKRALASWYTVMWAALSFEVLGLIHIRWIVTSLRGALTALCESSLYLAGLYVATLGTPLILYLSWSPVGSAGVIGMQSRYLFPSLLLLPAAFSVFYGYRSDSPDLAVRRWHLEVFGIIMFMTALSALYVSELHITTAARYW